VSLVIKEQGGLLGASVEGVDLPDPLTQSILEEIADALYAHQVISMSAIDMTPAQHVQIALHFGELELHATDQFAVRPTRGSSKACRRTRATRFFAC